MRSLPRIQKSWAEETLVPILVAGYFAWWTQIHLYCDIIGGVWGYSYSDALEYYSAPALQGFRSLPVQLTSITIVSALLAFVTLVWMRPKAVAARLASIVAFVSVAASVTYSCSVLHREDFFVDGTRQLILRLELMEELDFGDQRALENIKTAYDSYFLRSNR